jgi:hypothetical protein
MFDLKQKLVAVAIGGLMLAGSAMAQKDGDKRPPKGDNRVVVQPKGERPPPQNGNNSNQGNHQGDKKKP